MRHALLAVALACVLVLAGCVGDPAATGNETETVESGTTPTVDSPESTTTEGTPDAPTGVLEIHHIDVGQADATLIRTPGNETILVDTGDWRQDGEEVIAYLEAHGVERIDHLVATHPHADHIGGHAAVIEHFETEGEGVGAAYDSGVAHTSQTYENYLDAVETHDVDLFEVREGDRLPVENLTVRVLNPDEDSGSDLHENSVVLAVEFGEFSYLTTGDAESGVESELVADHPDAVNADVYQAGHHGSSTSSSEQFLEAVSPSVAVVSSARDSQYGHPHEETMRRFADHGVKTYWTGVHGDVVVTTDGTGVTVETEHDATTDPLELLAMKSDGGTARTNSTSSASTRLLTDT